MRLHLAPLLVAATLTVAAPAFAQRQSLADRVARLEQQAADNQANIELLNQLEQLRSEVQSLRATVEQLQYENTQIKQTSKDRYLDLDGRLGRLESGGSTASAGAVSAPPANASPASSSVPSTEVSPRIYGDGSGLASANDERGSYDIAFNALKAGQYADAAELFQGFLKLYPNGVYAPNALYWLGESYYVTENYNLAEQQFRALVAQYPTHDKAPGAWLKIGLSQFGKGRVGDAERTLNQVVEKYPNTDVARIASDRLRSIRGAQTH
ncbi:MAG: tol-pal system protein YbgF [Xanthomonadaceae bacterium]|jgi:tol-pal system protein YbgF|nr:tol-pal system protein YbgF [Xanthomonadaceae bacterium]